MATNGDYIYSVDVLIDEKYKNRLTEEEYNELRKRVEPVYYLYYEKKTYTSFNYVQKKEYSSNNRLILYDHDGIDYRYEVLSKLGKGAFGVVYLCKDHKYNKDVAVKVVRNERRFHRQVKYEIDILNMLNESEEYSKHVIRMYKTFIFRKDIFLVFQSFGIDLYNYYNNNLISKYDVKSFAKQIALGLNFIHNNNIIHMDLKPENILIRNKQLKIIDFGSSIIKREKPVYKDYIQSRYYRSPEVIFGIEITEKVDVWSYGCIIYELLTKKALFPAKSTKDLVIYFVHFLGYPPDYMDRIYTNELYFENGEKQLSTFETMRGNILRPKEFRWICDDIELKQLIYNNCLVWDKEDRKSMDQILKHPYLQF